MDNPEDNSIDAILKQVHEEIEPVDSWQALRTRIEKKLTQTDAATRSSQTAAVTHLVFWHRAAMVMAACFVITLGIVIYMLGFNRGLQKHHNDFTSTPVAYRVFNPNELHQRIATFEQVRELFGQQLPWIMIGFDSSPQMGLVNVQEQIRDNQTLVIVRLAVSMDEQEDQRQYYDVVTFSNQKVNLVLPLPDGKIAEVLLTPEVRKDNQMFVQLRTSVNGTSEAGSSTRIENNTFVPLVRLRSNGNWFNIEGIGQTISQTNI